MASDRKAVIQQLIDDTRNFRLCGPGDDPDEQSAVTGGYHYLVVQLKRLAGRILPAPAAARLEAIEVEVNDIYSVQRAKPEMDALLFDIEDALVRLTT